MPHLYTMQTTQWRQCRTAALPHCRAIEYIFQKNTWTFNNSLYAITISLMPRHCGSAAARH
jgi:hypothetical protein